MGARLSSTVGCVVPGTPVRATVKGISKDSTRSLLVATPENLYVSSVMPFPFGRVTGPPSRVVKVAPDSGDVTEAGKIICTLAG